MKDLFIPIVLGTSRQERFTDRPARLIHRLLEARPGVQTHFFDIRDFEFPTDDYGTNLAEYFPEWHEAVLKADAYILVFPEYNHSFPGNLKSLLDTHLREYRRRAVGLAATSAGGWGGVRAIENLVPVLRELGLVVTDRDLQFPKVRNSFDESGEPLDPQAFDRINKFLDDLIWMAQSLKWGRENL